MTDTTSAKAFIVIIALAAKQQQWQSNHLSTFEGNSNYTLGKKSNLSKKESRKVKEWNH